jgi:hypothetical protein
MPKTIEDLPPYTEAAEMGHFEIFTDIIIKWRR